MKKILQDLFHQQKPVIAMAHFPPLPGTPLYDMDSGVEGIMEHMSKEVQKLVDGGVDAILFCNEGDRPYMLKADLEAVAVMSRVISAVAPRQMPFGVDFLWDPRAPLAIALATGASFVREVFTGAYESDMGIWSTDAASVLRYRRNIGATKVKIFYNVTPEFASPLGNRSVAQRARSAAVSSLADAILISGAMAGSEPDIAAVREAKTALDDTTPVLVNTGVTLDNVRRFLDVADGIIVGSYLKSDGNTWNPVDPERVKRFIDRVNRIRR